MRGRLNRVDDAPALVKIFDPNADSRDLFAVANLLVQFFVFIRSRK